MSTTPIQLPALEPPKYYSPFDARAKLMNLQNLALQQQEGQQRLQSGQLTIEGQQHAIAQRQATDAAYRKAIPLDENGKPQLDENGMPQFDAGQLSQALAQAGHGSAIPGVLENHTKYSKSLADLRKVQGEVADKEQDAAGHLGNAVQTGNNDPHLFLTMMTQGAHSGAMSLAHAKALMDPVTAALDQDPTGETARALVKNITDQMIAGSPKERELATQRMTAEATQKRNTAQAGAADVTSLKGRLEIAGQTAPIPVDPQAPIDPAAWTAWRDKQQDDVKAYIPPTPSPAGVALVKQLGLTMDQRRQAEQAKTALEEKKKVDAANMGNSETELAVIATNPNETPERRASASAALKRLDQSKIASRPITTNIIPGVPTAAPTGAAAQLHGDDYLKTLPPAFAAQIKQLAAGNGTPPTGRAATSGAGLQIMNALYQYDPEYSQLLGQQRKENLHQFNDTHPGSAGGQLLALNTMIHHADLYMDAAAALKNGSFKPGNEIYNKVATVFGAAPPTNAALLAQFFASETGKVATGGIPAEGEIKSILGKMSTDGSPEAMEGAAKTLIQIAGGRMLPLKQRRDDAHLEKFVRILDPQSTETLQKRGFDPETMKPVGGAGRQQGYKAGDTRVINGKTYTRDENGNWK